MQREKTNILQVLAFAGLSLFFGSLALLNGRAGDTAGLLFLGVLGAICLASFVSDVRKGVRRPTRFEWFKAWMYLRPILLGALGIILLIALPYYGETSMSREAVAPLLVVLMLAWAILLGYWVWRAPRRSESDAAYRRRVKYREPLE